MAINCPKSQLMWFVCLLLGLCGLLWSLHNTDSNTATQRRRDSSPSSDAVLTTVYNLARDWFTVAGGGALEYPGPASSLALQRTGSSHALLQDPSHEVTRDTIHPVMFQSPYMLGSRLTDRKELYSRSGVYFGNESRHLRQDNSNTLVQRERQQFHEQQENTVRNTNVHVQLSTTNSQKHHRNTTLQLKYTKSQTQKKNKTKLIVFYNLPQWLHLGNKPFQHCWMNACTVSTNRTLLKTADAVMFHIFFFKNKKPPGRKPPGQIWVAFGREAPYMLQSNMFMSEWSHAFNWTMTHRTDSDVFWPYGWFTYRGQQSDKNYTQLALNKQKSAAWFVSNCRTLSQRQRYVQKLKKHYPVDIFGACGSQNCPHSQEPACMSLLNSTYRFYLSFENSLCRDYVTEKFFKLFTPDTHIIPVVRGGTEYKKYFPTGTFVDASDFKSPLHLARHLRWLERETEVYASMLRAKDQYVAVRTLTPSMCQLCEKLHFQGGSKWYSSLPAWLFHGVCKPPEDIPASA